MATIVTRAGKGSALTHAEVDANFTGLNSELATKANSASPSFTGKSQFPASTSTGAAVNLGSGANVTSNLVDGDVWVEGNNFRWQANGTTWRASAVGHVHAISGVTGLQTALDLKVDKTSSTGAAALPASTTGDRPVTPIAGYIRYNTTTGKFEGFGSSWGNIGGGASIGDTPPANPGAGDLWWESDTGRMFVYYSDGNSSQWVDISAGGAGQYLPLTGGDVTGNVTVTGNVGIGTTNPTSKLHVSGGVLSVEATAGGSYGQVEIGGPSGAYIDLKTPFSDDYDLRLITDSSHALVGAGTKPLLFYTDNVERARFDASGNFLFNSGYGSVATAYGCRAWVNFTGIGTVTIRASGNVSSITDVGTGDFLVNFTVPMPNINYSAIAVGDGPVNQAHCVCFVGSLSTTQFSIAYFVTTNSTLRGDPNTASAAVFR